MYGPRSLPFGGVVEDDVEEDLDAVPVQLLDQGLQLIDLHAELARGGVAGLGGEEAEGAVAPVVQQQCAVHGAGPAVLELVELVDRHQLDAVDAQLFQVGDLLADAGEGAGELDARRRVPGEAAHVHLVDDQVFDRRLERPVALPVEVVEDDAGRGAGQMPFQSGVAPQTSRPPMARA